MKSFSAVCCLHCKCNPFTWHFWGFDLTILFCLQIDEENYVEQFRPFLMDIVYDWCNGASFMELCKKTEIFEGKIF